MADFQSSKTAKEIEEVLTGAVLFNVNTKLSEEQKAQARSNIGATSYGEGIKIISHFDTLEELETAVTEPNAGDAYSVGANLPYHLYVYDFLYSMWRDYGAIRSSDISARFAQNIAVAPEAWVEDNTVFADYTWKAPISLGEVTSADFPIVVFSPTDAVAGNFCPIAYCFDGYVEIWARSKPATAISIPAITFIVLEEAEGATGNATKGMTNASGGVPSGSIDSKMLTDKSVTLAKLADDTKSKGVVVTLSAIDWKNNSQTKNVEGITANTNVIVGPAPATRTAYNEAEIYCSAQANGTLTFACSTAPTVDVKANVIILI